MLRPYRIGRVADIDVNVHPSFGLVLVWAAFQWWFGSGRSLEQGLLGILLIALVFASVLLHELGHCAMARQFGIRVLDITLWPFGGVARIEQMPASPRSELLISASGPAMNLAIAVALVPVILLVGVVFGRDALFNGADVFQELTLASLLVYLALMNLLIMVFNLLPAFPVDGGRMMRAALSPRLGRAQATSIAVTTALVLATLLIVAGLWQRNIILPILGVFIILAAQAESRMERVQSAMRRLKVGQYALWDMGGVSPEDPLTFALRGGPRDLVVTDRGRVVGMLWRSQLLDGLQGGTAGRTVGDLMDRAVFVATTDDSVYDVQRYMASSNRWAVPITEGGQYRGIFTADRFIHLYRQIAPGLLSARPISDDWREAIADTLSFWKRRKR